MSIIWGIINKTQNSIDPSDIQTIQQSLKTDRDDYIKEAWHEQNIALGNNQSGFNAYQQNGQLFSDNKYVIVSDARIDNRDSLKRNFELRIEEERLTDSYLILKAYEKWGEDCVNHLEGEFAFAVWNKENSKLFCAVDHIGFRPFFYYNSRDKFVFSSMIKGVSSIKKTPNTFNEESLIEYFFKQSDQTRTYNSEIFALCGGHSLTFEKDGNVKIKRYWELRKQGKYNFKKDEEWAECLRDLLFTAVENNIHIDAPVGVSLSGGLDSSSVACIAGKILEKKNKPLYAFSSVLPENHKGVEIDERNYIIAVKQKLTNLELTYIEAPGSGPFSNLEQAFEIEETLPNPFFYMDKAIVSSAQQKGIRTLLLGQGGDHFSSASGGYALYLLTKKLKFFKVAKLMQQLKQKEKRYYLDFIKNDILGYTKSYQYISNLLHKNEINWQSYGPLNDHFLQKYNDQLSFDWKADKIDFCADYVRNGSIGRVITMLNNRNTLYGMATGNPMFDKNVVEFILDVPPEQFIVGGVRRGLIRRAMEGILPPEVQWRTDKLPYSPDYKRRILKEKQLIDAILHSDNDSPAWKYIDKGVIQKHWHEIKPEAGMSNQRQIVALRIAQGIISYYFIEWLKMNGYSFN